MPRILRKALISGAAVSAFVFALSSVPGLAADDPGAANWGAFGVQTQWMNRQVKPGDDFDTFVNGKWVESVELPPDRTRWGSFIELRELSEQRLHKIMDDLIASKPAPGTDAARVAAEWSAFMDTDAINAAGLAPARPYLDRIYAAKTPQDLARLFASPGFASPLGVYVDADPKQSDVYALQAAISGLGLPDRDYYLKQDQRSQDIRSKYIAYLTFILGKAGYADPASAAKAVLALETQIARADWDRAAARNRDLTYNKLSTAEFEALGSDGLVRTFLESVGAGKASYIIASEIPPTAAELKEAKIDAAQAQTLFGGGLPAAIKLIDSTPVSVWQAWLTAHFLTDHASVLPRDIDDAAFDFYGKTLTGQPEQRARWKRGISAVEGMAGELIGKIYAEKFYPPENKAAMDELVANLRKAMALNLQDLSWMGPATRKEAEAKLDAFTPKIGAPEKFKEYEGLAFKADDPLGNMMAAGKWQNDFDMNRIGKPVDRSEWFMLPETVNAYYNPP